MHFTVKNLIKVQELINSNLINPIPDKLPKIIAVSKTFGMDKIVPLIEYGHQDFGENKVQEALDKWSDVKLINQNIKLHLIGGLQTNKVKFAIKLFDYIHSVDSEKLAKKIADEQKKQNEKIKIFLQVNIGGEIQKYGVDKSRLGDLYSFCKSVKLDVVGLMCIPPVKGPSTKYFKEMNDLNQSLNLDYLSMGMSSDYLEAAKNNSTHLRIGSNIFGSRI